MRADFTKTKKHINQLALIEVAIYSCSSYNSSDSNSNRICGKVGNILQP